LTSAHGRLNTIHLLYLKTEGIRMPRRKPSVSEIQLAANRANAAKSTGPRTSGGKARSAQNAPKHGFAASTFAVVRLEDLNEVAHLRADLIAVYQPVNSQELFAIERIALAQQAILRAARSRSSKGSKPCGPHYRTNPFSTPNPNQTKPLAPHKTNLFPPKTPLTVAQAAGRRSSLLGSVSKGGGAAILSSAPCSIAPVRSHHG